MGVGILVSEDIFVEEEGNAAKDVPQHQEEDGPRVL